jgi:hypothetical protein
MTNQDSFDRDLRAGIVCSHVAIDQKPILRAVRDEPTEPVDSGWQFLCGLVNHDETDSARVWAVCEILDYEPSLRQYMSYPVGTVLIRDDAASGWRVQSS